MKLRKDHRHPADGGPAKSQPADAEQAAGQNAPQEHEEGYDSEEEYEEDEYEDEEEDAPRRSGCSIVGLVLALLFAAVLLGGAWAVMQAVVEIAGSCAAGESMTL